jgi:hypothetical protein
VRGSLWDAVATVTQLLPQLSTQGAASGCCLIPLRTAPVTTVVDGELDLSTVLLSLIDRTPRRCPSRLFSVDAP